MSNANAPTRSVVVQTTLRVIENSEEGTLVVSDRGCQTAIVARPSLSDLNLLPLLEFIPYSEIHKGGVKVIKLPRKALLQFNLSGDLPSKVGSEVTYKSALKKSFSSNNSSALHLPLHQPSIQMAKVFEDQDCQTDLTVSPYILEEDSVANVRREIAAQTSVTFEPSASIGDVEPRLKEYLSHSHCFIAVYLHGKFTNLNDYQKQTGRYEPVEETPHETESVFAEDDDVSRTIPQQTEISVGKPQETEKDSIDYRRMTDDEFEENIGKILNRTVQKVTALMNRVVEVYEREGRKGNEPKATEPSEDSVYFSVGSEESKQVETKEVEADGGSDVVQLLVRPDQETKIEDAETEATPETNADDVETEATPETNADDVKAEEEEERIEPDDDVRNVKFDVEKVKSEDIEPVIRRIVEELLEHRGTTAPEQIASTPVGDTPEIKRRTHIECECAHPSEAGAAPPTLSPPPVREEPEEDVVVEAVEGKAVTFELIVTKGDGIALRDSTSCPETCSARAPCSDPKERIIRLSVVLPPQQHTCQCKTTDDKTIQGTQSDTQIYAGQKPSAQPCECAPIATRPSCVKIEDVLCGDRVLETCEDKKEDGCGICSSEEVLLSKPAEQICNCLSMQSFVQDTIVSIEEKKRSEATLAQLCECSTPPAKKPKSCCCFELPRSDDEDDSPPEDRTCGRLCSSNVPFLMGGDESCACGGEHVEIIYPERRTCSCYEVRSDIVGLKGEESDPEERAPSEVCSYCRNLQKTEERKQEVPSAISCTCEFRCSESGSREFLRHPEGWQKLSEVSVSEKEIAVQEYWGDYVYGKSAEAQTTFVKDSVRLIYQQSRNVVEPYMDKLRDFRVETPQVPEPSLLYLRDRRSIEQYMKTLDPEDVRDVTASRIPVPSAKNVERSKQMTLVAVEISSTHQQTTSNLTMGAAAWKVEDDLNIVFAGSFAKDTLTYVTNEEEVDVVERTSLQTTADKIPSQSKKAVTPRESVKFLFVSDVEHIQVATPVQSRTPDHTPFPPQSSKPEFLSNLLDTDEMPCLCQQGGAKDAAASSGPTPNLTCLFEDDSEYHEGYMEEMTDESVSTQAQLNHLGGKVPLLECAASLPDVVTDTNRCDSKMEMPWLRISLPPAGYYEIEKMEGRPKKQKTCDCWKLDTKDSVFLAESVAQKVICPARTPDEYDLIDENVTGDSDDDAEDDTPGLGAVLTDRTEAEGTLEEDQAEDFLGEVRAQEEEEEQTGGAKPQIDKKICVCLSTVEEDECAEFKGPSRLVYDDLCYEANEGYMDALYKLYPDDCDTECGSRTEIPWQDIVLPKRVKLRATKRKKPLLGDDVSDPKKPSQEERREFVPLFVKETPSRAKSEKSTKSDKSVQSQRSAVKSSRKPNAASSAFEIELNFAEVVSNLINIDGGAATQATVSQISMISDVRMVPKRCPKDYIVTVHTTTGTQQKRGAGRMQLVGSQAFEIQACQDIGLVISAIKIPEKTKSCGTTEANRYVSSALETTTKRKFESMPDVPSKSSNVSGAFAKYLTLKSGDREVSLVSGGQFGITQTEMLPGSNKPKISKESGGAGGTLKAKDPVLVVVRSTASRDKSGAMKSTGSKVSRRSCGSSRPKDPASAAPEARSSKESRQPCKSLQSPALGFLDVGTPVKSRASKESRGTCRSFGFQGPLPLDLKPPIKSAGSKESRGTCRSLVTEIKKPVVTCGARGASASARDPIMEALETYQKEMKPLRESLDRLKAKIRDLNLPELNSWTQRSRPVTPVPCVSMYGRGGVRYPQSMTGAPYNMPPPNMQMPFGLAPMLPPSYYPPAGQFNFAPPQNMYMQPPPQQFQSYPPSRTTACKSGRCKSKTRRRHRRQVSSKSSSEVSDYSKSGDDVMCPFLGTTSAVSCASLPKTCPKRRSSKALCSCRDRQKRSQRQAKTDSKNRRNQTQRIEKGTRTEPEVKIHFPARRAGKCKTVVDKTPRYVKDNKIRVAVGITPSGGETKTPSGEDSCACGD